MWIQFNKKIALVTQHSHSILVSFLSQEHSNQEFKRFTFFLLCLPLICLCISFHTMTSEHYCATDFPTSFLLSSLTEMTYVNFTSLLSLFALSNSAFCVFVRLQV